MAAFFAAIMSAHTEAMMRIIRAVARAKHLGQQEQRELRLEFEKDPADFLERYAAEVVSVSEKDLALFREPI